jgi:hypothetical protein
MTQTVKQRISALTREGHDLVATAGRLGVQIGLNFANVDALISEHGSRTGYESIRAYLETEYPDLCTPFYGSSEAYRNLQAGRVALIIGDVGDASVNALQPLHKLANDPPTLLGVWREAKGRKAAAPTRAAIEKAMPEGLVTRGPKAGSAKAGNGARAKAAKAGTTKAAKAAAAPTREETVTREVPPITGSATKAAKLRLERIGKAVSDRNAYLTLANLIAQACDEIGSANVLQALAEMSAETPPTKAAPRKRTAGNTRKAAATKAAK